MTPTLTHLLANLHDDLPEELFESLVDSPHVRIERIVSKGHRSPDGFWYDQPQNEWVLLLKGDAVLEFEGEPSVEMQPGTAVLIPAHCRHRVIQTSADEHTVWLAVHFD
ncbi:MAG: cupin domain-containing protein [Planctomycetota bacterium]|nr:cupin domain-containing protein [Planctomycetota bacterium]MDA1211148.1 cupin domain-containing protein [Planctomycetota bacterium]